MALFEPGSKEFRGKFQRPWRSSSCDVCLRSLPLFMVILFGFFIPGTIQGSSTEHQIRVRAGSTATLSCNTSGISAASNFSWLRRDGKIIPRGAQQNNGHLIFPIVNRTWGGVYICRHYANGLLLRNDTINLIVQYPAEVSNVLPSSLIEIKPGDNTVLRCDISANPPFNSVSWTLNGVLLQVPNNATLGILNAKCSNNGIYQCVPSNGLLPTAKNGTFHVTVRDKPSKVNMNLSSSTTTSLTFYWTAPSTNGCLPLNYTVIYWAFKTIQSLYEEDKEDVGSRLSATVDGLMAYTEYVAYLKIQNAKGTVESDRHLYRTNIGVPSAPLFLQSKITSSCQIEVKWEKPLIENAPNITYRLSYRENTSTRWTDIENIKKTSYYILEMYTSCGSQELQCSAYEIKVTANSSAGYGNQSNVTLIYGTKTEVCSDNSSKNGGEDFPYIIIVAVFLALLLIAIIIIIAAICARGKCRCCRMPFKKLFSFEEVPNEHAPMARDQSSFKERREREAVPYEKFWQHVTLRHADTNYRFSSEFESLQGQQEKNKKITWVQSQKPENHTKNRFANVVAYDQTRVVLSTIDSIPGSHYINANYVDSYKAMNFYIATQGPLANTIGDFWRMVWEQNCRVIVMITKIIEKGRHKCAQYWPTKNRKSDDHGTLRVTFLREEYFAFYTVREFEIKPIKEGTHYSQDSTDEAIKPMIVQQFHFTGWPDHGVPDPGYEVPVLDFVLKSTAAQVEGAGPIIVHCSAGVGRSGAYIVIDSMIKRIHDNGDLNIFSFLAHIRQQRNHLVQEECQYIFVHDVLLEYINCGFLLSLPKRALKEHLYKIRTQLQHTGNTKIVVEFERLKNINIQEYNLKEGQKTCNVSRNRNPDIIPADTCRVKLYPRPGVEGSDYINASCIDGFWRREAYIATQCPLESTLFDFWRMIWQENCRSIVMLLSNHEADQNIYPRYLPVVHDTARFGVYEVTMESESARGDFMIRDLKMTSVNEPGETRKLRHFHFIHWPEEGFPWSGQSILQLVSKVDEWEKEVKSNSKPFDMIGPIVVHCSTGVGRTGVYCILHTLWHQVTREDVVSVYPTARLHFHQRPKFLLSQAQYEFCYDTMVEYIDADCSLYLV